MIYQKKSHFVKEFTADKPLVKRSCVKVSDLKLTDVRNLLIKHFGETWEQNSDLTFYTEMFAMQDRFWGQDETVQDVEDNV